MSTKKPYSRLRKIFVGVGILIVLLAAATPWFQDNLLSADARSEISHQIQSENLQGNKVIDGELICDGLCVNRYPFFTKVSVQEAGWVIPFWGSVYRVN